jgi:magnesium transporter
MLEFRKLVLRLFQEQPQQCAAVLEKLSAENAALILSQVKVQDAANVLSQINAVVQTKIVKYLDDSVVTQIAGRLNTDILYFILRRMEAARAKIVLSALPQDIRKRASLQLRYPSLSAGAIADPNVLTLTTDTNIREAIRFVNKNSQRILYYIYLLDKEQKLQSVLSLKQLIGLSKRGTLSGVANNSPVTIPALMPFSTLAQHPAWQRFHALPVVDKNGLFVGVIRHKQVHIIMDESIRRRQTERSLQRALGELYWVGLTGLVLTPFTEPGTETDTEYHNDKTE